MQLKEREILFCEYYHRYGDATRSAIEAGYAASSAAVMGHKLLKREHIQEYLESLGEKNISEKIMTNDEILEKLSYIARDERNNLAHRIRALELLGKRSALWIEKVETNDTIDINITIGDEDAD